MSRLGDFNRVHAACAVLNVEHRTRCEVSETGEEWPFEAFLSDRILVTFCGLPIWASTEWYAELDLVARLREAAEEVADDIGAQAALWIPEASP